MVVVLDVVLVEVELVAVILVEVEVEHVVVVDEVTLPQLKLMETMNTKQRKAREKNVLFFMGKIIAWRRVGCQAVNR